MTDLHIMYGIAGLLIFFGFVALLLQKTYVSDPNTGTASEIDLPFIGKLKTNYPALIFVFLGCALAYYAFGNRTHSWRISGTLGLPEDARGAQVGGSEFNWSDGTFTAFPSNFTPHIERNGSFDLTVEVAGSGPLEDFIKELMFEHPLAKKEIPLTANSIKNSTESAIQLKPQIVEYFGKQDE